MCSLLVGVHLQLPLAAVALLKSGDYSMQELSP